MKFKRIIIAIVVLLIVIFSIAMAAKKMSAPAGQTQYRVADAATGLVKKTVSATGTLQPWTVVDIKSKAGGRVDKLLVEQGTVVTKNQVIAKIDPSDTLLSVRTAQADLESSQAKERQSDITYQLQLSQSRLGVDTAKAQLQSAIAGRDAAKARLNAAQISATAQPSLTRTSVRSAKAAYDTAVQQRKQLDSTNKQDKALTKASYDQALANDNNAQLNLKRQQSLLAKGFVSQQAVDQAQANAAVTAATLSSTLEKLNTLDAEQTANNAAADARVAQARAQWLNARAGVDVQNKQQAFSEAKASYLQASAQVGQAQVALNQAIANQQNNSIRGLDIKQAHAGVQRNAATVQNAQNTLDQTTVRAPSEGIILKKYVEQGTIITSGLSLSSTGTSIVQLGDITRMYVDAQVDETDLAQVDEGQAVDVTLDAYPGLSFEGKVTRIDPQSEVIQNVTIFHVRVEIDNSAPSFRLLRPGMNATCEFVKDKKEDVLCVPNEAVQTDDNGNSYVEVIHGGRTAPADPKTGLPPDPNILVDVKVERRTVELGLEGNDTTEIVKGLKAGDKVVIARIEPVTAKPSAASGSPFGGGRGPGGGGGGRR